MPCHVGYRVAAGHWRLPPARSGLFGRGKKGMSACAGRHRLPRSARPASVRVARYIGDIRSLHGHAPARCGRASPRPVGPQRITPRKIKLADSVSPPPAPHAPYCNSPVMSGLGERRSRVSAVLISAPRISRIAVNCSGENGPTPPSVAIGAVRKNKGLVIGWGGGVTRLKKTDQGRLARRPHCVWRTEEASERRSASGRRTTIQETGRVDSLAIL